MRHLRAILALATLGALVVVLFWPTLRWLVASWLGNPYYSHGFLIPPLAAFLAWRRRDVVMNPAPSNAGLVLLAGGLLAHLASLPWRLHVLSALGLIVALAGLVWTFWGTTALRRLAFPLALLVAMVPLPWVERVSPPLEALVAQYATLGVQALGVAARNLGAQVFLADTAFVVGAPCSGVRSLVALLTLAALLSYVVDGPGWARMALFLTAAPIALLANLVRVSSLFWVADRFGAEAGLRYYHDLSSPMLFLLAFALLIATTWLLGCRTIREDV